MLQVHPHCLFIAWFEETAGELQNTLGSSDAVVTVSKFHASQQASRLVVMVEHYPIVSVEDAFFVRLNLEKVPVMSSLDEPIFQLFGGERITEIMRRLGIGEDEILDHAMISNSIERAQRKISEKVALEKKARAQAEWFMLNYPK
jgi:hypothetical protein